MRQDNEDPHFAYFAKGLETIIAGYGPAPKNRLELQRTQMEALMAAEVMFRKSLIRHRFGEKVFRAFIDYIHEERHNILAARPFYRERVEVFKDQISPALAAGDPPKTPREPRGLYKFNINFQFINFCMSRFGHHFSASSQVRKSFDEVRKIRNTIIEQNMPLAISRAKVFRSRTQSSPHFSNMDSVQTAIEGLVSAVDKFVGPFSKTFRSVIIGRATGNMISAYSESMLHFFPGDKQKIYRANKARRRHSDVDKIVAEVNTDLPENRMTNADEIQQLLNANSHLSLDSPVSGDAMVHVDNSETFASCAVDQEPLPNEIVERKNSIERLGIITEALTLVEKKALVLVGLLSEI
jgi:DNA-directed RNA polymerase specialized sigma subunit